MGGNEHSEAGRKDKCEEKRFCRNHGVQGGRGWQDGWGRRNCELQEAGRAGTTHRGAMGPRSCGEQELVAAGDTWP